MWAECPFGMIIQGIKRSKQMYSWIYDIEGINCCHVKNVTPSYENCYEKAESVPRNYQGWVQCEGDYYVAGFFQGKRSCKDNSCKERLKCCNFVPRGMVNIDIFYFSIVTLSKNAKQLDEKG